MVRQRNKRKTSMLRVVTHMEEHVAKCGGPTTQILPYAIKSRQKVNPSMKKMLCFDGLLTFHMAYYDLLTKY